MSGPLNIVVVGAGIGGLGSALGLARAGHRVVLVERDDTPMPPDPESAFEWNRRGAPQVRHPHVFLGLAYTILRDRFPDVLAALADLGVGPAPMQAGPTMRIDAATLALLESDGDLRMLPVRRTTFEWVMRTIVAAQCGIDLRLGAGVSGLEVSPSGAGRDVPTVTGVRLEDGSVIHADLVVASTGRRGDVPAWLAAAGVNVPETTSDCGVVYYSRFYRTGRDGYFGFRGGFGAGLIAGVIGSDAGTYSITAVVDREDRELRAHLSDSDRFDATMRLLPELADVAEAGGRPVHPVHCMTGLINRTRSYTTDDGIPRVAGLIAVGDAHTCTNPAYGRGQSLALLQSTLLVDALSVAGTASPGDLLDAVRAYEGWCAQQVIPWYQFSVLTDQMRAMASPSGSGRVPSADGSSLFAGVLTGAAADPMLVRTVLRVMHLLEPPQALIEKLPEIQAASVARPPRRPGPRTKRPSREDLLAVLG